MPPEEDRAVVICNVQNSVKIGRLILEICSQADKHTNRQTDTLITILHHPLRGRVITIIIKLPIL